MRYILVLPMLCGVAMAYPHHHHVLPLPPMVYPMPAPMGVQPVVVRPVVVRPVWFFGQRQPLPLLPPRPQEHPVYQEPVPLQQTSLPELPPAPVERAKK